jgi:hypothetical protein
MLDMLTVEQPTKPAVAAKPAMAKRSLPKDDAGGDHEAPAVATSEQGAPTPTERRHMLIEGCKDFDKKFPPGPDEVQTAEAAVDDAIAKGVVTLSPEHAARVQAAVDQVNGAMARMRTERQAKAAAEDEANGEELLVRPQREVTIQFRDDVGEWVLKQKNWPDDDAEIWINEDGMSAFLEALRGRVAAGPVRAALD